ncbi:MAG: hypothetical protein WD100_12680 [Tistlia sp.]|uniref:hypothetical protein n=1 Tax=Tistlia sp. TaxID=3057121 RepID=UPI0034A0F84B
MVYFPLLLIYIVCCFGVGYLARNTRAGFIGVTLISVVFSPLLVLLAVLLLRSTDEVLVMRAAANSKSTED